VESQAQEISAAASPRLSGGETPAKPAVLPADSAAESDADVFSHGDGAGTLSGGAVLERFVPASDFDRTTAVYQMWNVLDRFAVGHNYGCVDKSPFSPKGKATVCTAKSDRFNPFVFAYIRPSQLEVYTRQVRSRNVRTYCEIGMNAGHGTVAMLMASPELQVHTFDLLEWKYSDKVAELIAMLYPGRFHVYRGSSFDTVPAFSKDAAAPKCGAALIDGLHTKPGATQDLVNMRGAVACDHVLFIDDLQSEVGGVVDAMVAAGDLEILERHSFDSADPSTCLRIYERIGKGKMKMMALADVDKHWKLVQWCNFERFAFAVARYRNLPHCT
jgi:hypothetical protein